MEVRDMAKMSNGSCIEICQKKTQTKISSLEKLNKSCKY